MRIAPSNCAQSRAHADKRQSTGKQLARRTGRQSLVVWQRTLFPNLFSRKLKFGIAYHGNGSRGNVSVWFSRKNSLSLSGGGVSGNAEIS
jgi:hypothetical protein